MDFIANLIKRPMSVIKVDSPLEDADATVKSDFPVSAMDRHETTSSGSEEPAKSPKDEKTPRLVSIDLFNSDEVVNEKSDDIKSTLNKTPSLMAATDDFSGSDTSNPNTGTENELFVNELYANSLQCQNNNLNETQVIFKVPLNPINNQDGLSSRQSDLFADCNSFSDLPDESDLEDTFRTANGDEPSVCNGNITRAVNTTFEPEPMDIDMNNTKEIEESAESTQPTLTESQCAEPEVSSEIESRTFSEDENIEVLNEMVNDEKKQESKDEAVNVDNSKGTMSFQISEATEECTLAIGDETTSDRMVNSSAPVSSASFPLKPLSSGTNFPISPLSNRAREAAIVNEIPFEVISSQPPKEKNGALDEMSSKFELNSTFDTANCNQNFPSDMVPARDEKRRTFCINTEPSKDDAGECLTAGEDKIKENAQGHIGSDKIQQKLLTQEPRRTFCVPEPVHEESNNNALDIGAGGDASMYHNNGFKQKRTSREVTPEPMEVDETPDDVQDVASSQEPGFPLTSALQERLYTESVRLSTNLMSCDSPVDFKRNFMSKENTSASSEASGENVKSTAILNSTVLIGNAQSQEEVSKSYDNLDKTVSGETLSSSVSTPFELSAKELSTIKNSDEKEEIISENQKARIRRSCVIGSSLSPLVEKDGGSGDEAVIKSTDANKNDPALDSCDFDSLLSKGSSNSSSVRTDRNSVLLKFDPLFGAPVVAEQQQQQKQEEQLNSPQSQKKNVQQPQHQQQRSQRLISLSGIENNTSYRCSLTPPPPRSTNGSFSDSSDFHFQNTLWALKESVTNPNKNAKMSVDIIDNDCNKSFDNSNNTTADEIQKTYKMEDIEKKIKNEYLKTEEIERKLKEAEQREEALLKRITEKDTTIEKFKEVISEYDESIRELLKDKEEMTENYQRQLNEIRADRDSNYHHLASLETTFSDLHVKYEKSKEMTAQLKANEEVLLMEKRQMQENLRLQEQRYEKMKNHAILQLETANKKLEVLAKEHSLESTKLKAQLKKEEISRASINEQLQQKTRENAELMKICDELINQGS